MRLYLIFFSNILEGEPRQVVTIQP